jgi:3-phosphoshikimate 1-carboxyvinyltransferase
MKHHSTEEVCLPSGTTLKKEIFVPGDKSVTHRAVMFGAMANGESVITTNALGRDNFATIRIFNQLGVSISLSLTPSMKVLAESEGLSHLVSHEDTPEKDSVIHVQGRGVAALRKSEAPLDCGNSGTTARLLCGVLASTNFSSILVGDHSLQKRPFGRIADPLGKMGVQFSGGVMPLTVWGVRESVHGSIIPQTFELKKASAQVKSAILLAGLFGSGVTRVIEPVLSRDHTERMLSSMGAPVSTTMLEDGRFQIEVEGSDTLSLSPLRCVIPGDFSAAMFFIVAGLITKNDGILIRNVGVNPTRTGALEILKEMGAHIELQNESMNGGEPVADVLVCTSDLKGISIGAVEVARAIDEIPILGVLAAFAEGPTRIHGAEELRVKESDRISMVVAMLKTYGIQVKEFPDGFEVYGRGGLSGEGNSEDSVLGEWTHCGDHRISMSAAILQFALGGEVIVYDFPSVETSFPTFLSCFNC